MGAMIPRSAATLILLRPGERGPEVLMLQRAQSAVFLGVAYVFPGGSIDADDSDPRVLSRVKNLTNEKANLRLGVESGGLAFWVAAVRECFEEAGIALLLDKDLSPVTAERAESLMKFRQSRFVDLLESEDLYIPGDRLDYFGHWITAPGRARRFDARFLVAVAPEGQAG